MAMDFYMAPNMTQTAAPSRQSNPETIPAVPAAPMDASFFARLRVLDDHMFLTAATGSALKGRLAEVSAALSTLRSDKYEPLLHYHDGSKAQPIRLPSSPLGLKSDGKTAYPRVYSIWDVVALALTSEEKTWSVPMEDGFIHRGHRGDVSPFSSDRCASNDALLQQALQLCFTQTQRCIRNETKPPLDWTCTSDQDGTAWYGPGSWVDMLNSFSKNNCQWADINRVIDAIPLEVIEHNEGSYQRVARSMIKDGNAPCALHLLDRHEALAKDMFSGLISYSSDESSQTSSVLQKLASRICWTDLKPEVSDLQVDAALEIMSRSIKQWRGENGDAYVTALNIMLPALTGAEYNSDWDYRAANKMIAGLISHADNEFGVAAGDPWPTSSTTESLRWGNIVPMRNLLDTALKCRHELLVDKLHAHWSLNPQQVDLLQVTNGLDRKDLVITDEMTASIVSIFTTARRIGIDLNVPFTGEKFDRWEGRKATPPGLPLHAVAKATKEQTGQLELLQALVSMDLDPTVADKRGWRPKVFIVDEEDRVEWDDTVYRFAVRQRANDAMTEIMSGEPPPKRPRVRKPSVAA